jgi:putative transposase
MCSLIGYARKLRATYSDLRDDHPELEVTRKTVFGGFPWQHCQHHLQQNAVSNVPHKDMPTDLAAEICIVFNARDRPIANV